MHLLPQIWKIAQSPQRHQITGVTVLFVEYHTKDKKLPLHICSAISITQQTWQKGSCVRTSVTLAKNSAF